MESLIEKGICKLPFIDEERLLMETGKVENELKVKEMLQIYACFWF